MDFLLAFIHGGGTVHIKTVSYMFENIAFFALLLPACHAFPILCLHNGPRTPSTPSHLFAFGTSCRHAWPWATLCYDFAPSPTESVAPTSQLWQPCQRLQSCKFSRLHIYCVLCFHSRCGNTNEHCIDLHRTFAILTKNRMLSDCTSSMTILVEMFIRPNRIHKQHLSTLSVSNH